ncbi:MAG TPA: hypothetical protein VFM79_10430 [Pelobium sp.]|nr:hypothetical protein [Pelobium sp.]
MSLQNLINNWFNVDSNTSATILITILVFISGILFTEILKELSSYFRRRKIRKICDFNFKNLETGIEKQSKYYLKYCESLNFQNTSGFKFTSIIIHSINIFENIGYSNIYEAYFFGFENLFKGKKELKAFAKLWSSVVAIPQWQNQMKDIMENQIQNFNKWNDFRNNSLAEFYKIFDPLLVLVLNPDTSTYLREYLLQLDEIQVNFQIKSNYRNLIIVQESMVLPTLEINRKFKHISETHNLNPHLLSSTMAFENMEKNLNHNLSQAKTYYFTFKGYSKLVKIAKTII